MQLAFLLFTPAIQWALVRARPVRTTAPRMGGGMKQQRPTKDWVNPMKPAAPAIAALGGALPKMVVFDLDNTVWTPELYTLRHLPGYARAGPPNPVAGKDVWLLDGAAAAFHELATCECWRGELPKPAASSSSSLLSLRCAHHHCPHSAVTGGLFTPHSLLFKVPPSASPVGQTRAGGPVRSCRSLTCPVCQGRRLTR